MPTLDELQKQIADLQAQADQMKREKRAEVLEQIRRDIQAYELTAEECGFESTPVRGKGRKPAKAGKGNKSRDKAPARQARAPRAAKAPKAPRAAKAKPASSGGYRGPNGEQWAGGKGPRPKWVKEILASGGSLDEYKL